MDAIRVATLFVLAMSVLDRPVLPLFDNESASPTPLAIDVSAANDLPPADQPVR